jgi:hypothetical protein
MNWKGRRSNGPWPNLRHYPNIYPGLRKTTNNLSHNSLSLGRDLKPGPHGYEARVLTKTTFGGTRLINICAYIYIYIILYRISSGTDFYYLEAVKTISEFRAIATLVIWTQKCFTQNTSPNSISYAPHLMWMCWCVTSNLRRSGKKGDNAKCRISVLHVPYVSWTSHVRSECCNEI